MKRFVVTILVVACALASGTDTAKWQTFKSAAGRFSAAFPRQPMSVTQPLETKLGKVTMYMFAAQTGSQSAVFAGYADCPAAAMKGANLDLVFEGMKRGMLKRGSKKLTSERRVVLRGVPGREYLVTQSDGVALKVRAYVSGNRVYALGSASKGASGSETKRFLDSFRIL